MSEPRLIMLRRLRATLGTARRFLDTGNFLRFLVAVVLAFGLWAWVTYENDPETTRTLVGITVTLDNLENNFELVGEAPEVDVVVQGPQSVINPLERDSVSATVDMEDVEVSGEFELEVNAEAPSSVRVREVVPETVVIQVDQIGSRDEIPVEIREPDDVPPNYRVREIEPEVDTVTISGPELSIDQVVSAEIPVEVEGRTTSFTDSWEPVLVNEDGEEVAGVQVEPPEITVSVELDVRGQVRKVIPVIVGDDALAPGYELVRTTILPSDEIVVDGPEEDLANIFFVTTVPVDISGWDETEIVRDVDIDMDRLPETVALDQEAVHVSVEIRRQVHQREISDVPISVMNPAGGTEITLNPETATVVLEGSRTAVEAVDPDDITVFVNVANADAGEYEFEVRVIVPAQVQYREVNPSFTEVVIEDETGADENDQARAEP